MELGNISDVIRAGMTYERTRAEVASYNLAMANIAMQPGDPSPLLRVSIGSDFASRLALGQPQLQPHQGHETRVTHDPSHPLADDKGMVHYPRIEAATEMATLVSATRAYEANIRSYNAMRAMTLKAFEIGK